MPVQAEAPILLAQEIRALNAARSAIKKISHRANTTTYTEPTLEAGRLAEAADAAEKALFRGRLAEAADAAEKALFRILNVASSYCDAELTKAELHNETKEGS